MVLANSAKTIEAVEGLKEPPECIILPYLGCTRAITSHRAEKTVEYIERIRIEMESQLFREECISWVAGQPRSSFSIYVSNELKSRAEHTQVIIVIIIIITYSFIITQIVSISVSGSSSNTVFLQS
jgi:hypothetical protein